MESCFAWPSGRVANRDSTNSSKKELYKILCITTIKSHICSLISKEAWVVLLFFFLPINSLVIRICRRTNILFWQSPLLCHTKSDGCIHQITLLQTCTQWGLQKFGSSSYFSFQKLCPHIAASNNNLSQ